MENPENCDQGVYRVFTEFLAKSARLLQLSNAGELNGHTFMAKQAFSAMPDVAISDSSGASALVGFTMLAILLFAALAYAHYWRKKQERDGIYSKYKLPGDPKKIRR